MKITAKHASNSPVRFVTHKRFVILFFLPCCGVHSQRSLISWHLQGKTPLCGPLFKNLHFWCRNALNGEKKNSQFSELSMYVWTGTINQTSFFSLFLLRMTEIVTTWRERRIDQWQTGNRKAPSQSHLPLCFHANSTPILVWVQTFYISFAKQQSKRERLPQGYVIIYLTYPATSTIVLWLIHFLSTKNDYAIPRFIKSNPLCFIKL